MRPTGVAGSAGVSFGAWENRHHVGDSPAASRRGDDHFAAGAAQHLEGALWALPVGDDQTDGTHVEHLAERPLAELGAVDQQDHTGGALGHKLLDTQGGGRGFVGALCGEEGLRGEESRVDAEPTTGLLREGPDKRGALRIIVAAHANHLGVGRGPDLHGDEGRVGDHHQIKPAAGQGAGKGDASAAAIAQACALYFGLVPENLQAAAARKLSEAVTRANDHVDVGLLGSKALFRVLSDHGYHEQAYRVATQRTAPGYGYMLAQGCTTLTEDWLCGGSQNHVMLGDISAWFYQYLAGIQVDETAPGFRHFYLKPRPVGDLTWVSAEHHAPRGLIQSKWERQAGGGYRANFIVPPGCRATVDLPDGRREIIAPGSFVYTWG